MSGKLNQSPVRATLTLISALAMALSSTVQIGAHAESSQEARSAKSPTPSTAQSAQPSAEPATSEAPIEVAEEPPLISDPMKMVFRISRLERGVSPDSRLFIAPRVITLTAVGPIAHLDESVWRGKRLAVFHKSPVQIAGAQADGQANVALVEEKVGEIKIQSVYQATMQAVVSLDDVTRGLAARRGEARVVMLGDVARLERPIKPRAKPKVRRARKPKQRSPYEREDMRWRL